VDLLHCLVDDGGLAVAEQLGRPLQQRDLLSWVLGSDLTLIVQRKYLHLIY
jgi:hypothetical protein